MFTINTMRFEFEAAHRPLGPNGELGPINGHSWSAEVQINTPWPSDAESSLRNWIRGSFDSTILLHPNDVLLKAFLPTQMVAVGEKGMEHFHGKISLFGNRPPFIMPFDNPNPNAESLAKLIATKCKEFLPEASIVMGVRIYEGRSSWTDFIPPSGFGVYQGQQDDSNDDISNQIPAVGPG